MSPKLLLIQALVALATAKNPKGNSRFFGSVGCDNPDPVCQSIQSYILDFPLQTVAAQAYCAANLRLSPSIVKSTATVTVNANGGSNGKTTVTTTTTPSVYRSTETCFQQNSATPGLAITARSPWSGWDSDDTYNDKLSSACSCFSYNIYAPTTKATTITTTKSGPATVTSTVTASAVTATKTVYINSTGSYTADDGTVYTEYNGYDFYGYNVQRGPCGTDAKGRPSVIYSKSRGNFTCGSFEDCQNVCSEYNDRFLGAGHGDEDDAPCAGITWNNSGFCYLKAKVPGNGASNCSPLANQDDDSAILVMQSS